jgi:hypothetical protein
MGKTAFLKIRFGDAEISRILPSLTDFSHGFIQISDSKGTAAVALSSRLASIRKSIRPNTFFTVFGRWFLGFQSVTNDDQSLLSSSITVV